MSTSVFSPITLNGLSFKNRIGVAPMTRMSAADDAVPRKDVLEFLVTRARNGAGMVYTEALVTDEAAAQGYPGQARLLHPHQVDAWKSITDRIRAHGAVSVCQIFHCGRMAYEGVNPVNRIIAPSPIPPKQDNPLTESPYPVPEEMTRADMDLVIQGFVATAKGAMAAGFDALELHAAHGYLLNQFLSAYSNQRTDEYGGSLENRFRFVKEVIEAVRPVIPKDRLLIIRISDWGIADMDVSLFRNREEWQDLIRLFAAQPIDAISVSTYDFSADAYGSGKTMAELTREVTDLPLMICGRIYDAKSAEAALEHADFVLSGKSMLLNPDWVEDVRANKELTPHASEDAGVAYTGEPLP